MKFKFDITLGPRLASYEEVFIKNEPMRAC